MKALVLGSNGYIGRHLTHYARLHGWSVSTSDIHPSSWNRDDTYISCDLTKAGSTTALDWDVDLVFHFTGIGGTIIGYPRYSDFIDGNEKALIATLEAVRAQHPAPPKLIFPSSRLVYRGQTDVLLKESAPLDCLTMYAANKRAGEMYIDMYNRVFGLRYTIFRICVPYGNAFDEIYSYGTIGTFLRYARAGRNIPLYGDGKQKRTFTHIEDLCRQTLLAAPEAMTDARILNIGGPDHLSIREAAALVAEHYGVRIDNEPWPPLDLACESGDTMFDSSLIEGMIQYQYRYSFSEWVGSLSAAKEC